MESTSCGCNCPFVKQGFCSTERECPNYIETWWSESQQATPKMVKDCSPKRMLLQQQAMQVKLEQVQVALCESRNEYNRLAGYLKSIIQASQQIINPKENHEIDTPDSNVHLLN